MLAHDALVGIGVAGIALVGADDAGELGRAAVRRTGHHRRDRGSQCAATLGVVGQAHGHEERAEVGVADAQLAVVARGAPDRLGREVGEADRDVHGRDDELHRATEALGIECAVLLEELQQVERGEVARRVVEAHVFGARVGRGDAAGLGVGVPVVDRVVVLDARISACPRRLAHRAEQRLGVDRLDDLTGLAAAQAELGALLHGAHELIGDAHGVVGVLVLHGGNVSTAQIHVEAGIAQGADLVFLAHLGLDELLDVGVVDVKHDHLGRAARGTTGLDGARGRIGATHERHRAGGRAAGGQQLLGRADAREVEASAGATLEDQALLAVPVEDRVHGVVDGEDEAGRDLLRGRRADVEPHGRVEAEHLVQQHVGELVLEDLRVLRCREVAVLAAGLRVGEHHPIDELAKTRLPRVAAHGATEVLGRHDRRCVDAPEVGELDTPLLEHRLAGLPVGLDDVATFPRDLVVRVNAGRGVEALQGEAGARAGGHGTVGDLGHAGVSSGWCGQGGTDRDRVNGLG